MQLIQGPTQGGIVISLASGERRLIWAGKLIPELRRA
jgi:hypothetical protein